MTARVMVLGAGLFQLPMIRAARDSGAHVITVDNITSSPGNRISDAWACCSTTDIAGVLALAQTHDVDAIVSMASDIALPALAHAAGTLALVGPTVAATECMVNKVRFRAFQAQHGLAGPSATVVPPGPIDRDELAELLRDFPLDVVVKPVDSSGSRGVRRVRRTDTQTLARYIDDARSFARSKSACVEGFVDGVDVTVEGFVQDGAIVRSAVTQKFQQGFAVTGHRLPGILNDTEQSRVRDEIAAHLHALGYRDGPFDADVRWNEAGPVVLEMAPRLGGNGVPLIASRYLGCDLVQATLDLALGQPPRLDPAPPAIGCGSLLLTQPRSGVVASVASEHDVRRVVPAVSSIECVATPGDRVEAFEHGGNILGLALFDCDTEDQYLDTTRAVDDALALVVEPSAA
jgi:biotin carboxylase